MFIDKVRVDFKAGNGGNGAVTFGRDKKPSGGNGGRGGDVYLLGENQLLDLSKFDKDKLYSAGDGLPGGAERSYGKNGKDLIVKVPLVTEVFDLDGNLLGKVQENGQLLKLCKGGIGGLGNFVFRRGQRKTLRMSTSGKKGEDLKAFLSLQIISDIILIGLPNAGKTSILNILTQSQAKVADYPFTTLQPNFGVVRKLLMLDLPGLIEGSAEGKGLGRKYTKHINNAKVLMHCISLTSEDVLQDYKKISKEVLKINPELNKKTELIVLTKADEVSADDIQRALNSLKSLKKEIVITSIIDDNSIQQLADKLEFLTAKTS